MDENVPLTNADLLAKLQDLENRLEANSMEMVKLKESNSKEMIQLHQRVEKGTAAKLRNLSDRVLEMDNGESSNTKGEDSDADDEKESLPESTASFFVLAKYPFLDSSQGDDDVKATENSSSSASPSDVPENNDDPVAETTVPTSSAESASKWPGCCASADWTSRDVFFIPFWFALFILILQVSIYFIIFANAADFTSKEDPFQFPIGVDPWTRAAEFLATAITVYSQADFFDGLNLFGYSHILVESPDTEISSLRKCYFAATTQVLVGISGMLLTFLLIMQSTDVVDLLLNFTAMEFVASLDDLAFMLAKSGYLGLWSAGKKTAELVSNTQFEKTEKPWWLKRWPHFIMIVVLYSLWGWIISLQVDREFGDNEIYVQFSDTVVPWLGTLSGEYEGTRLSMDEKNVGKNRDLGVIIYENNDQKKYCQDHGTAGCKRGIFFYCLNDKEWRFNVIESTADLNCQQWLLQGIHDDPKLSGIFDILAYSSANWFARDPEAETSIALRDEITMIKSFKSELEEYKKQEHDTLESFGVLFDYPYYHKFDGGRIRDRPIYTSFNGENGEFVAFNGYRWIAVHYNDYECSSCAEDADANCLHDCVKSFDPYYSNYKANLISDPMKLQTSEDTWVPSDGLVWNAVQGEANGTQPDVEFKGLPILLSAVLDMTTNEIGLADPEARAIAFKLFAQTARLSRSITFKECLDDETLFSIDLVTDVWPNNTKMIVMDINEANPWYVYSLREQTIPTSYLLSAFHDVKEDNLHSLVSSFQTTVALNETSTFPWDPLTGYVFGLGARPGRATTYRYITCLPRSSCAAVLLLNKESYGVHFPGKFDLYLGSMKVFDDMEDPGAFSYCLYQLGPNCGNATMRRCELANSFY